MDIILCVPKGLVSERKKNLRHDFLDILYLGFSELLVEGLLLNMLQDNLKECKKLKLQKSLGKPQKKVPPLVFRPPRGGGGKGRTTKQKKLILKH